jgi:hypothetical protein
MNERLNQSEGGRSCAAYALWAWTMLLVVLLSASPTGGQPGTRMVGSAFDPATSSVVINPKSPKLILSLKGTGRDKPSVPNVSASSTLAIIIREVELPLASMSVGRTAFAGSLHAAVPGALARSHPARAPPSA